MHAELGEAGSDASDIDSVQNYTVKKLVGVAAVVSFLFAGAGFVAGYSVFHGQAITKVSSPNNVQQLAQIIAKPKREACAKTTEDCFSSGCCDIEGYNCFETKPGSAMCMKNCTPSKTKLCTQPQPIMDPILVDATSKEASVYCFSVVTQNTGSTKKSYEAELLAKQFTMNAGVFACQESEVFSDAPGMVTDGLPYTVVSDVKGDFHFAKRKHSGTWVNTGMFVQVWKAIAASEKYKSTEWVVKVDIDAVFIFSRLQSKLAAQMVPANGVYLVNCPFVEYGYFGNLEIFSVQAFDTLIAQMDVCYTSSDINWKVGVHGGKYGPMGEDLFAQTCLDLHGVRKAEAFDYTTDGACPADRPEGEKKNKKWKPTCDEQNTPAYHPFKKPDEHWECYEKTVAKYGK
jgi:hypothetical protein